MLRALVLIVLLLLATAWSVSGAVTLAEISSIWSISDNCADCCLPRKSTACDNLSPSIPCLDHSADCTTANYTMKEYCIGVVFQDNVDRCYMYWGYSPSQRTCWAIRCQSTDAIVQRTTIWADPHRCQFIGEKRWQLMQCAKYGAGRVEVAGILNGTKGEPFGETYDRIMDLKCPASCGATCDTGFVQNGTTSKLAITWTDINTSTPTSSSMASTSAATTTASTGSAGGNGAGTRTGPAAGETPGKSAGVATFNDFHGVEMLVTVLGVGIGFIMVLGF
ncbi:hypothetical protein B0H63DRAFT_551881 [Podospora didyma]|uniref:Uncharacterized protein n=1 Tax=Podospora didyma TaxID=330526 RepID=A0AAE0K5Y5_9PEZI|nr:hypothetical protein B0H63DRAFT_551881 [Podospora didyma]